MTITSTTPEVSTTTPPPSPSNPPTPGSTGNVIDLDAKVRVGGKEVTVGDLVTQSRAAEEEAARLREYRRRVRRVIGGDGTMDETWEQDTRHVLDDIGMEPSAIDAYIDRLRAVAPEATDDSAQGDATAFAGRPTATKGSTEKGARSVEELEARLAKLETELERREQTVTATREHQLQGLLAEAAGAAATADKGIQSFLRLAEGTDEEGSTGKVEREKFYRGEVARETEARIRRRIAAGGRFSVDWFHEEAPKAAATVAARYRTALGNPDRLGRVPETDSGEDVLVPREPLKDPEYARGDGFGEVRAKARKHTEAAFLEMLAGTGTGPSRA